MTAAAKMHAEPDVNVWLWDVSNLTPVDRVGAKSSMRRMLLSRTYGGAADDWHIDHDPIGKPHATGPDAAQKISVSAAQSGDFEVFASTRRAQMGVDVETTTHSSERLSFVCQTFSAADQKAVGAQLDRNAAIIDLWTQREAYGKALGVGLSALHGHPRLGWQIQNLAPGRNLRLAIAIQTNVPETIPIHLRWIDPIPCAHQILAPAIARLTEALPSR